MLRGMNSETVDLIATDPPFNKKRNRSASAGQYEDAWRWEDDPSMARRPDQWLWQPVHRIWLDQIRDDNEALFQVIEATRLTQDDDTAAFLCFLGVRLMEMHRVLKLTGSIYLHCDHTANGYIRMVMDAVFRKRNFRNEIVWCYTGPSNTTRWFPRKHDTILFYTKDKVSTFHSPRIPHKSGLHNDGTVFSKTDGRESEVREKERQGKLLEDYWTDIGTGAHVSKIERTGSPDQKPLALYERIIRASSNEDDLVLDPFAGCATTPIAAHNLGRRWVGIDRREDAAFHITNRLLGLGINVDEFKARQQYLIPELQGKCEIHYEAPVRTDTKETAAPDLGPVFRKNDKPILNHREMKEFLVKTFGTQCWGCDFDHGDERYLQLDHADPKADGGSNDLDNRTLLCGPCNLAKSRRITLGQLRRQNAKENYLIRPPGTRRSDDGHPINLPQARQICREAMERHRRGMPLQIGMML